MKSTAILLLACAVLAASCSTQRHPRPMEPAARPLPPGDGAERLPGNQEVVVMRLSDPVQVRRAGETAGYPLAFHRKQERVRSGAWVLVAAGGRVELLWPGETSSVLLLDEGVAVVGEPSRGEPIADLRTVTIAKVTLAAGARVELPGGAVLAADPDGTSGPFLLDRVRPDVLRVVNQSKTTPRIAYRDAQIDLPPGEQVDLPLLAAGTTPFSVNPLTEVLAVGPFEVSVAGQYETELAGDSLWIRAVGGPASVRGGGVVVRLEPGEEVHFGPEGPRSPAAPPSGGEAVGGETDADRAGGER